MKTPQLENGYTKIANELLGALAGYRIPGEQMQCLLFIIRKTYGYNKKEDYISNSQFCDATGLKPPIVCRAINGLLDKNLIIKKDNKRIPSYLFNKNYKGWKVLSKKITVIKKDNVVIKKDKNRYQKRYPQKKKETIQKKDARARKDFAKKDKKQLPENMTCKDCSFFKKRCEYNGIDKNATTCFYHNCGESRFYVNLSQEGQGG